MDRNDIWRSDASQQSSFIQESLLDVTGVGRELGMQNLDRHSGVEILIPGMNDYRKRAVPDLSSNSLSAKIARQRHSTSQVFTYIHARELGDVDDVVIAIAGADADRFCRAAQAERNGTLGRVGRAVGG